MTYWIDSYYDYLSKVPAVWNIKTSVEVPGYTLKTSGDGRARDLTVDLPGVSKEQVTLRKAKGGLQIDIKGDEVGKYLIPLDNIEEIQFDSAKMTDGRLRLRLTQVLDSGTIIPIE
jgi:HSP20 family molecular chaperone IbpA